MTAAPVAGPVRIGNCSGFYGDRLMAMREMLEGGPIDVITGDYLAELTMLILQRSRAKDPAKGYATTFLHQLETCIGIAAERDIRIVVNAGGLNPAACAEAVYDLADRIGVGLAVGFVEGDDLMSRRDELGLPADAVTANAYLGCWGIVECLRGGSDVVVTGRVTDASLVAGPAAWRHGWRRDDFDQLAGAVVAGHVLECGAQATGGNYAFFAEVPGVEHPGFPLAEVHADGSSVITKHEGTGGQVSIGTVTAQLLYEIGSPHYLGPDVIACFETVRLTDKGGDRVLISGVKGLPPPPTVKVAVNRVGGMRNRVTFLLTGLDVPAKADLVRRQLAPVLAGVEEVTWRLDGVPHDDPATQDTATAVLTCWVKDSDPAKVGRAFSGACVELALSSYPGCTITAPPGDSKPYGIFSAAYVDSASVHQVAELPDGTRIDVPSTPGTAPEEGVGWFGTGQPYGPHRRAAPLGRAFGARSGDKGGDANVGVWARDDRGYRWLYDELTVDRLRELLPETDGCPIERWLLPNLRAVNFVVRGLLGEGVASGTRLDPQAKALGEWLRARVVELPVELLDGGPGS